MGLNQLFNKDLVFCLHAKDQTDLFELVRRLARPHNSDWRQMIRCFRTNHGYQVTTENKEGL